jgi:formyltetrahydrofolate synthetase
MVREHALRNGAFDAQIAENWEKGGEGAVDLARAVVNACQTPSEFKVRLKWTPCQQNHYICELLKCQPTSENDINLRIEGI